MAHPGMTKSKLLPVAGQHLLTRLAEAGAVLLQARQHHLITVVHLRPAEPRDVAGAGVMALLLRRSHRGHQHEGNDEKKSGHVICFHPAMNVSPRLLSRFRAKASPNPVTDGAAETKNACVASTLALCGKPGGRNYCSATLRPCAARSRSSTVRQPLERLARCLMMQAVTFGMFGISELQRRNASPVHICWASALKAKLDVDESAENAAAKVRARVT